MNSLIPVSIHPTYAEELPAVNEIPRLIMQGTIDTGHNRDRQRICHLAAQNDYEAFCAWLETYKENTGTQRAYRREIERLFLWCVTERHKLLTDFTHEDFNAYFDFLDNPSPCEKWCAPPSKKNRYGETGWRPFIGPLTSTAKRYARTIIKTMLDYWVGMGYWTSHPLAIRQRRNQAHGQKQHELFRVKARILDKTERDAFFQTLQNLPEITPHEKDEKHRLHLIVMMLYFLGLRINELLTHNWNAFREVEGRWWYFVKGKGSIEGKIPVHGQLLSIITAYRAYYGMAEYPQPFEAAPIIKNWNRPTPLSARHVNRLLKKLMLKAVEDYFPNRSDKIARLEHFSAHWLRHLSASMQDSAGISLTHIRENLRHSKIETTKIYLHAEDTERYTAIQKLDWIKKDET